MRRIPVIALVILSIAGFIGCNEESGNYSFEGSAD